MALFVNPSTMAASRAGGVRHGNLVRHVGRVMKPGSGLQVAVDKPGEIPAPSGRLLREVPQAQPRHEVFDRRLGDHRFGLERDFW